MWQDWLNMFYRCYGRWSLGPLVFNQWVQPEMVWKPGLTALEPLVIIDDSSSVCSWRQEEPEGTINGVRID